MAEFKSGFVTLIGRTNVGKSTLINLLVGEKVAAIANKVQTTRTAIRGIVNRENEGPRTGQAQETVRRPRPVR